MLNARHRSVATAIRLYMPAHVMGQWMHNYFSGDFLRSPNFKQVFDSTSFHPVHRRALPDKFTMDLTNPERKRNDRELFTNQEIELTQRICAQNPALSLAVVAFQASFFDYLDQLQTAVTTSAKLLPDEKARGVQVLDKLKGSWLLDNFVDNILPAVALHYHTRTGVEAGSPLNDEDFSKGMKFAFQNGMFMHDVTGPKEDVKKLSCPARNIIAKFSDREAMTSIPNMETENVQRGLSGVELGTGLFHIYRQTETQIAQGGHVMNRFVADTLSKIEQASRSRY